MLGFCINTWVKTPAYCPKPFKNGMAGSLSTFGFAITQAKL